MKTGITWTFTVMHKNRGVGPRGKSSIGPKEDFTQESKNTKRKLRRKWIKKKDEKQEQYKAQWQDATTTEIARRENEEKAKREKNMMVWHRTRMLLGGQQAPASGPWDLL